MSRDSQNTLMELEIKNFEPLTFDLKTKFIKRELSIFDALLNKILEICFQAKIYDEICISLQELYNRPLAKVKPPQSKFHEISEIKSFFRF